MKALLGQTISKTDERLNLEYKSLDLVDFRMYVNKKNCFVSKYTISSRDYEVLPEEIIDVLAEL